MMCVIYLRYIDLQIHIKSEIEDKLINISLI
jgi:hypothetical protein